MSFYVNGFVHIYDSMIQTQHLPAFFPHLINLSAGKAPAGMGPADAMRRGVRKILGSFLSTKLAALMWLFDIPSGKRLQNYGKSPCLMGKLTISMAIFNSYVKLPEGSFLMMFDLGGINGW